MNCKSVVLLALCAVVACSCGSYKRLAYLQDMQVDTAYTVAPKPDARIKVEDRLRIVVTCSSPALAAPFNIYSGLATYEPANGSVQGKSRNMEEKGYTVDKDGNIDFPVLGKLHVEGLTLEELKAYVEEQIKERNYIKDPIVYTEFLNFEVVVLGESGVGRYNIPTGGVNIFELLAMSHDLTGDAIRSDVRVIRTEDGVRKAYSINLKSVECYNSPVFYLKQNDMVYALPKDTKLDTATSHLMTTATMIMSVISTIGTVFIWTRLYNK